MKNIFLFVFIGLSYNAFTQGNVNIVAGVGFPELINFGLHYNIKQVELGTSFGFWPVQGESVHTFSGEFDYHFGKDSKYTEQRTWFGKTGIIYLRDETVSAIDKYVYLNASIGKDFEISRTTAIRLNGGLIFELSNKYIEKGSSGGWTIDVEAPALPCLGVGIIFHL